MDSALRSCQLDIGFLLFLLSEPVVVESQAAVGQRQFDLVAAAGGRLPQGDFDLQGHGHPAARVFGFDEAAFLAAFGDAAQRERERLGSGARSADAKYFGRVARRWWAEDVLGARVRAVVGRRGEAAIAVIAAIAAP